MKVINTSRERGLRIGRFDIYLDRRNLGYINIYHMRPSRKPQVRVYDVWLLPFALVFLVPAATLVTKALLS